MGRRLIWLLFIVIAACSSGKTIIRSEPPTALVSINGVPKGVTPLEVKLNCNETKKFKIQVSAPGYRALTKIIHCRRILGPKKDIIFELKPGEASPVKEWPSLPSGQKDFGTIEIKSIPSESEVFLNDDLIGTTPIMERRIKGGNYILEVRKKGFKSWRESIEIKPGEKREYSPILEEE